MTASVLQDVFKKSVEDQEKIKNKLPRFVTSKISLLG
jgi:predicted RecB family endonuclease